MSRKRFKAFITGVYQRRIHSLEALATILQTATSPTQETEREFKKLMLEIKRKEGNVSPYERVLEDYKQRVYQENP